MRIDEFPDLQAFQDAVKHSDSLKIGHMIISIKTARIVATALDETFKQMSALVNDKADLKAQLATLERELQNRKDELELVHSLKIPPLQAIQYPVQSNLERRLEQLEWRVAKLEKGIGTVEHLTRDGA